MEYLDFESPIKELQEQIQKCKTLGEQSNVDVSKTCKLLEDKLEKMMNKVYSNLTAWQRVQLSRHPSRPYTLDYINAICGKTFLEMHGDRNYGDDKAIIGGLGKIEDQSFMFIGMQKGYNTKTRQYRNFGMAKPEGYRKAQRLMMLADKFNLPVITFVDTAGAFPGKEAEERGQSESIASSIQTSLKISSPIISIVIGEGGSGGAIALATADRVMMLEHSIYSVISPEGCASILWRSSDFIIKAAENLKLTAQDCFDNKIIDSIIDEVPGGAHRFPVEQAEILKKNLLNNLDDLKLTSGKVRKEIRNKKFLNMTSNI